MRLARLWPLAVALPLAGCLLTSGQIAIQFDLADPLVVDSPTAVIPVGVDLNTLTDYADHKDNLKAVADLALLGEITNNGSTPLDVEFWMTRAATLHTSADQVRNDPTAARAWGPFTLAALETRRIDWDGSAALFSARQALLEEIQGDGVFTLYALGPAGGATYNFTLRQGVLLVVLDGGV